MKRRGAMVLSGVTLAALLVTGGMALAQAPSESVLRERERAIERAIQGQIRQSLEQVTLVEPVTPRAANVGRTSWLHQEPLPSAPVIAKLEPGTPVTVTGQVPGGEWLRVEYGGRSGYLWRVSLSAVGSGREDEVFR